MTVYMKQGDLLPELIVVLKRKDPVTLALSVVDLTDAVSVKFLMANAIVGIKINLQNCDVDDDPATGQVGYRWQDGDTDTTGGFNGEFEVDWGEGVTETFPGDSYLKIKILASLDGA